jgi:hypothetical protein
MGYSQANQSMLRSSAQAAPDESETLTRKLVVLTAEVEIMNTLFCFNSFGALARRY